MCLFDVFLVAFVVNLSETEFHKIILIKILKIDKKAEAQSQYKMIDTSRLFVCWFSSQPYGT